MTTKPKARKFRLRRGSSEAEQPPEDAKTPSNAPAGDANLFEPEDDGFGGMDFKLGGEPEAAPAPASKPTGAVRPNRPQRGQNRNNPAPANPAQAGGKPVAHVVRKGRAADPQQRGNLTPEQEIAAIQKEGLTGRQLRIARRVAQRNGMNPTSDMDAVRLLREQGIDPFARENMLQLVAPNEAELQAAQAQQQAGKGRGGNGQKGQGQGNQGQGNQGQGKTQLPQTIPQGKANVPGPAMAPPNVNPEAEVAKEVRKIQRDIVRRRRKRGALLMVRLMFFVFMPTLFAGSYYFNYATPMFATNSQFIIQQAENQSAAGGLGSMFSGTALATSQDAVTVQSYLQSRDAMLRLNEDLGFKAHFSADNIDVLQRLDPDASNEDAYKVYQRHVKIGFDPTEGLIKMEVIAADPASSQAYSEALIAYAEEQVDNLTQRLREDQMAGARESFESTELRMLEAQQRVIDLQEQRGVMSAEAEASSLMSQISTFEVELQNERLRLQELQENANPNRTRVAVIRGNIARLDQTVTDLRSRMTDSGGGGTASLARISGELMVAQQDLQTRTLMLQQSLQQLETARIEANRQVRYLSMGVSPIAPDEATYPRSLENTILAFMIFGGIYLMLSLTASILREQVSG